MNRERRSPGTGWRNVLSVFFYAVFLLLVFGCAVANHLMFWILMDWNWVEINFSSLMLLTRGVSVTAFRKVAEAVSSTASLYPCWRDADMHAEGHWKGYWNHSPLRPTWPLSVGDETRTKPKNLRKERGIQFWMTSHQPNLLLPLPEVVISAPALKIRWKPELFLHMKITTRTDFISSNLQRIEEQGIKISTRQVLLAPLMPLCLPSPSLWSDTDQWLLKASCPEMASRLRQWGTQGDGRKEGRKMIFCNLMCPLARSQKSSQALTLPLTFRSVAMNDLAGPSTIYFHTACPQLCKLLSHPWMMLT